MNRTRAVAPATVEAMRSNATALLAALPWRQRRRMTIGIDDYEARARWFYTPNPRRGLALNQLTPHQQQLALQLLASGLSAAGFTIANLTMASENLLDRQEGWGGRSMRGGRDPLRYAVAVFGDPNRGPWGWRFEGHHLSVRYVIRGDSVRCTPLFIGGHPARSPLPDGESLDAPLTPIRLAIELLEAMSPKERARAVISPVAPVDIVVSNRSVVGPGAGPRTPGEMMFGSLTPEWVSWRASLREELGLSDAHDKALQLPAKPDGVALSALGSDAQASFRKLIAYFVRLVPDDVAEAYQELIEGAGSPHFAWAGAIDEETASYFRIRNERLLIEFDNAQDQANHVHAALRDPVGDFGRDILGEPAVDVAPRFPTLRERVVGRLERLLD